MGASISHGHAVLDDIQVYADNVLRAAKEGRLFKSPQPGYLLWRLAEWMPSVCGEVMSAIQLTDPQLDLFVMAFLNHSRDSIKGNAFSLPEDIKRLEAFMPLADLRKRAQQRLEDTLLDYPLKAAWRAVLEGKKLYALDGSEARR